MPPVLFRLGALLAAGLLVGACGQRGPLVMPIKPAQSAPASSPATPPPDSSANSPATK